MARAFAMPYKFIIIGILLIIIYYVYSVSAKAERSEKEPFIIGESIFDKALDRLNPLAASQNPLTNQAVVTGISEGDGITSRLMNQMALNIPTVSLSYESGPNGWTVLPAQCNKANTYVESSPTQCSASGMRQKYLYQSDAGGACIQQAAGDPECDPTCPGANTQGGCNYHACDKTGQVPFSEVTDISQCDALGNRQAYAWASSPTGSCIQDISGAPHCDPIRCPGANTLNGCAYCDTDASTKPTCPGYITPYTCTRADNPPADTCTNYKRRPVSWTNAKATATNAAECTAVTYGTAVCDASCNPPQQSTDPNGCGYVAAVLTAQVTGGPPGTRGWISVASSADGVKLVAAVNGGQVYTSTDSGVTWTPRDSSRNWQSVASSSNGVKLVAVVGHNNAGTDSGGRIYTSTDSGATWTPRESNRGWLSVASSSDGVKLVAGVNGGQIYISTDSGLSWTARGIIHYWFSVISSSDAVKLVAVANSGYIYTSIDSGVTWTPSESTGTGFWRSVAASSDGVKLIVGNSGYIFGSTDSGVNWTPIKNISGYKYVASSSNGVKLVAAVNGGQIYTSADSGATWTARESNRQWQSVASSSDGVKLVAVVSGGQIYTSTDSGVTWTPR